MALQIRSKSSWSEQRSDPSCIGGEVAWWMDAEPEAALKLIRSDGLDHGHGAHDLSELAAIRVDRGHAQQLRHTGASAPDSPATTSSPVPTQLSAGQIMARKRMSEKGSQRVVGWALAQRCPARQPPGSSPIARGTLHRPPTTSPPSATLKAERRAGAWRMRLGSGAAGG